MLNRAVHLDALRGAAALLVLVEHVRALVFVDYAQLDPDLQTIAAPFYLLTTLGRQAVIMFFALSGFLVGAPALVAISKRSFKLVSYLIARFSRLWTVIIPALLLTLVFDLLGRFYGVDGAYTGQMIELVRSGPKGSEDEFTVATFFQNVFFLQNVTAPTFGSNGPLWSISNEFWYYILGPLLGIFFLGLHRSLISVICGVAFIAIAVFLPQKLVWLGAIWIGAAVYRNVYPFIEQRLILRRLIFAVALVIVVTTTLASARGGDLQTDLALGFGWSLLLPALANSSAGTNVTYSKVSFGLSEISFTLYAVHFPIVFFMWATILQGNQFPFSIVGGAWFGLIVLSALMSSWLLWWLFEKRTKIIRNGLNSLSARLNERLNGWMQP